MDESITRAVGGAHGQFPHRTVAAARRFAGLRTTLYAAVKQEVAA